MDLVGLDSLVMRIVDHSGMIMMMMMKRQLAGNISAAVVDADSPHSHDDSNADCRRHS